jgi:four helix bundle protein
MSRLLDFRGLDVWQRSMDLAVDIYALTAGFPRQEMFGLAAQARSAASSVPANIAEGNGRLYRREYAHHVSIGRGSAAELWTYLELPRRLGYVSDAQVQPRLRMADDVSRMLLMLTRALTKPRRSRE